VSSTTGELRSLLSDLPLSQLRATLPPVHENNPEELVALLEICVLDERSLPERLSLVDYLITLASTETRSGSKRVARDPAELTPGLESVCAKASRCPTDQIVELVRQFHGVREEVERGDDIGPIRQRVRKLKQRAQMRLLAPEVLRASVACNVALWNRLEELTEVDRTLENAECRRLEALVDGTGPEVRAEPAATESVFRSKGIAALAAAIRARLEGSQPPAGGASELVDGLPLGALCRSEETAFTEWEEDDAGRVMRAAVVVGLIIRRLDGLADGLGGIGIDAGTLCEAWISELASELLSVTEAHLSSGPPTGAALRVAEVRTRFLRLAAEKSLWSEADAAQAGDAALEQEPSGAPGSSRSGEAKEVRGGEERSLPGWPLLVAACLLVVAVVGYFQVTANPAVELYSGSRLSEISRYLESAYGTDSGRGPLLVGTLTEEWSALSGVERVAVGKEIGEKLGLDGVPEVMLFDGNRRLEVHYAEGRLRHVARSD
jgi:hypothetical protein